MNLCDISYPLSKEWYESATESDRKFARDWLQDVLLAGQVLVTFLKVDGSTRKMLATLKPEILPLKTNLEETTKKKENNEVCVVWDLEASAWRSFRYDRIISIDQIGQ